MKWLAMLLAAASVFAVAKTDTPRWEVRDDFATVLAKHGVVGTIVVLDEAEKTWFVTNRERAETALPPASTFKLFNAMVALDERAVAGAHEVVEWDGVTRAQPEWNRDHDLASGMAVSAVWLYQEMARRVGRERMTQWLERAGYGNRKATGPIDRFWSDGTLKISARDQVLFLHRLADDELPFSHDAQAAVRAMIVAEDRDGAVLRGKTGMLSAGSPDAVGWYVGWLERDGRRWFFAVNFDLTDDALAPARIEIAKEALAAVGAWRG